ncbi:transcription termination protein NusA [Sporocytophaga myxococcoides]|uniref:Ribosome maturation factor RimP n=1 Tax=Sporocytophaga myxococcoides TaxID=153721 RepID=A0A098LN84_9BACT|nr:ribosome maturation factor [Sporocytophaga myxococcoides]GAL87593.1 transcription termination protein NusA [Sporocytophaga myxococcoides]
MKIEEKILQIAEKNLSSDDLFIVDLVITGNSGRQKISITLDGDKGVDIDTCAYLSRKVGNEIEETNLIDSAYVLEVSSPGVDQPLKLKRQYYRNIGRRVSVTLLDESQINGLLKEVNEREIVLDAEKKDKASKKIVIESCQIAFSDIKKTNVLVSFK